MKGKGFWIERRISLDLFFLLERGRWDDQHSFFVRFCILKI